MSRKMYLQIPPIILGALILSVILLACWLVAFIPVMIYPRLTAKIPVDGVQSTITKKMIRSSVRKAKERTA